MGAWSRTAGRGWIASLALLVASTGYALTPEVEQYLHSAAALYKALEFERVLEQCEHARRVSAGVQDDVAIDLFAGLAQAQLNRPDDAAVSFLAALSLQPDAVLPLPAPPKVKQQFERIRAEIPPAPPAPPPQVVAAAPIPVPAVHAAAPAPPARGWAIAVSSAGLVVAGVGGYLDYDALTFNQTKLTLTSSAAQAARSRAQVELVVGDAAIGVGVAAAVGGLMAWLPWGGSASAPAGSSIGLSIEPGAGGGRFTVSARF
jgi:hypothetical protein